MLSAGQRKRVALARLLLVLLPVCGCLDEPYANLDAQRHRTGESNSLGNHATPRRQALITSHGARIYVRHAAPTFAARRMEPWKHHCRVRCAACVDNFKLIWRRRGDAQSSVVRDHRRAALFPLALGPETALLARIAAGTILDAPYCFRATCCCRSTRCFAAISTTDRSNNWCYRRIRCRLLLACKIFVHWPVTTALPLLAVSPLLAQLLHMPADVLSVLLAALALSTPLLSLIGAVCVALTVGMRRSGMLLALLVLPLIVPVLIFGAGACDAAQMGLAYTAPLLWLSAWLVVALVAAPLAAAAALKISLT